MVRIKANWEVPKFACVNKIFTSKLGTGMLTSSFKKMFLN